MKISQIMMAFTLVLFASCGGNQAKEHGHEHGSEEHGHEHGDGEHHEHHEQEEFTLSGDSVTIAEPAQHSHDDGGEHHSH
jgi:hypothetical protein